ncbi:hypothetical protein L4D20_03740 [Vibrio kyushuensis]|uniref:hypothetical protein n=1 Tax=Vibrio kyushuensis TaxID=2910249 RepID=UPI003D0E063B
MSPILSIITSSIAFISTEMIVSAILMIFAFSFYRSILDQRSNKFFLNELSKTADKQQGGLFKIDELTQSQRDWLMTHLLINEKHSETISVEMKGDLLVSKSSLNAMLPHVDQSKYKLIPAILTSIGITGTFIGITLGLSEFSMGGGSKELLSTAMQLLEGMNTAFYTSLVGLLCSAMFMIWMKISSHTLNTTQEYFAQHLAHNYVEVSAIDYLKNLSNDGQQGVIEAQHRSALAMEQLGSNMATMMSKFESLANGFNSKDIADAVSGAVTHSIEKELAPVLTQVRDELTSLRDIKEQNQKELLQEIISEMKTELITPVVVELEKTSEAVTASNKVSEELNKNVEQVISSTANTVETINEFQKETMVKLQEFAGSLKTILSSFKEDTQGAMSTIATEVQSMLEGASTGLAQQRDAFESSATKAADAFEGIKSSMESALDERQVKEKSLFDGVENRIDELIKGSSDVFKQQTDSFEASSARAASAFEEIKTSMDSALNERQAKEKVLFDGVEARIDSLIKGSSDAFTKQTEVLKTVGEEASTLMTSAKDELQAGLGDIDSKVQSMSTTVQTELEAFRQQYQDNLTAYFKEQNELLESNLGKQRDGLNGVVDNFRTVFEQEYKTRHNLLADLTAQHEHLQKSAETVERVVKAIGLNEASKMAELQEAAHTMSLEIAKLKREYVNASKAFSDVANELPKAMDSYFSRANDSFEVFFKDFDESASKIHNKLSQAAGYLINSQVQRKEFEADEVNA